LLGLSQAGLADLLGWSNSRQVSNIERGTKDLMPQTELAIECLLRRAGKWGQFNEKG